MPSPSFHHSDLSPSNGADQDAFLGFIEYARAMLWSEEEQDESDGGGEPRGPPCSWIVARMLKTCMAYPSGVTSAILLSDVSQAWSEQNRHASSKRRLDCPIQSNKQRQRKKLQNTVTIDSIYEKNFLSSSSILDAVVLDAFLLPGTKIWMLTLGDIWSSYTIDLYLHRRFYDLVNSDSGILRKGREIRLTGCCLRSALEGCGHSRLLPTEYLVVLLDEDQDEDAMLLAAQFCSDSFSSVSVDAFKSGSSYSFCARITSIGPLESQGSSGCLQRKQVTLTDNDGVSIKFLLWGEQVLLANLLTVGSMLAVDGPFVSSTDESNIDACEKFCLEYGSATQLYLVPFVRQEEPVLLTSTQLRYQGSRLSTESNQSQNIKISQVALPLDYEGSIDFKNYPFQAYITDLRDKMTNICLYGVVTSICRENNYAKKLYRLTLQDATGEAMAKLHFLRSWSLGRVDIGHTIYISGLTCSMAKKGQIEVTWFEKDPGTSLINISSLPALLNSACLHKLSCLSQISNNINTTHICKVHLHQIEHHEVSSRLLHADCGHFMDERSDGSLECSFCVTSEGKVLSSFLLQVILADGSSKTSAWCTGPTAADMLQICPDEFYTLPEDEKVMYLCTLENECFIVALVNSKRQAIREVNVNNLETEPLWEIVRAQKCE